MSRKNLGAQPALYPQPVLIVATYGADKALLLRLGAVDYAPGGNTLEDAVAAAKLFEQAGLDLLDISGGMTGYIVKGHEKWQGYYTPETARLKQEVSIPVLMTGGITDPQAAEEILKEGKADLIGVAVRC